MFVSEFGAARTCCRYLSLKFRQQQRFHSTFSFGVWGRLWRRRSLSTTATTSSEHPKLARHASPFPFSKVILPKRLLSKYIAFPDSAAGPDLP